MKRGETSLGNKLERQAIEKNRRIEMKELCFKLVSLIPADHFKPAKEFLSEQDQLEQAAGYIKLLRERIEELRRRKTQLLINTDSMIDVTNNAVTMSGSNLPILEIRDLNSSLEVVLISGLRKNFMLHQVISILEEEGAQVVTVSLSTIGDKIFHTLHAQVKVSRLGVDTSRIGDRIQELIS
ncbi:hypothetical protein Pfo_020730 [Paulownia fortunei]|nr:hypothetical protein Pfo_020730 [Paulownia fortunei]